MLAILVVACVLAMGVGVWLGAQLGREREARALAEAQRDDAQAQRGAWVKPFPLGAARLDEAGRLHHANPALHRALKRAPDSLQGFALTDLAHVSDLQELSNSQDGEEWHGVEARLLRGDGRAEWHKVWRGRDEESALLVVEPVGDVKEWEREVKATRRATDELYEVVANEHKPIEQRMSSLLELGCARFGLETGVVSQLRDGKMHVQSAVSPDGMVRRGDIFDVPASDLNTFDDHDWKNHPIHVMSEAESFLGAPIFVSGRMWGTLYFCGRAPRPEGFAPSEHAWIRLMASWLGGDTERRESRLALEAQARELEAANTRLEALATHDGLTGVKNRRAFNEQLDKEHARARRYGTPLSLLLMDVDKFKTFNDTYGHPAGDEVLKMVAKHLQAGVRNIDFVARYGGEEFVVLLPNTPAAGAMILAERLRTRIEDAEWPHRQITISLGCASMNEEAIESATLTERADQALYASKEAGRNRATHYRELSREKVAS